MKEALDNIVMDDRLQMRASLCEDTIAEYKERMQAGDTFPPVSVMRIDGQLVLVDGWHRISAAAAAGMEMITLCVESGTSFEEAMLFAAAANNRHGLRRSNADKRRAVELLKENLTKMSNRQIAKIADVSHEFVNKVVRQSRKPSSDKTSSGESGNVATPTGSNVTQETENAGSTSKKVEPQAENTSGEKVARVSVEDVCRIIDAASADLVVAMNGAVATLATAKEQSVVGAWIRHERFKREFLSLASTVSRGLQEKVKELSGYMPDHKCPQCKGVGCDNCRHCGWIPKSMRGSL